MTPDCGCHIPLGRLTAVFILLASIGASAESEFPGLQWPDDVARVAAVLREIEEHGELFLPDAHFIRNQCKQLLAEAQAAQVQETCVAYENDQLDGDEWLRRLSPVLRRSPRCPPGVACQVVAVPSLVPIPKGFKSYSLALFPTIDYEPSEIERIREAFFAFGEAIGERRAAIWFEPGQTVALRFSRDRTAEATVDVSRSKHYCDRLGLNYNDGPYVVMTERRPDIASEGDERIVVKLGGISGNRVVRVLNVLEQDLRNEREVRTRALLFEEMKQRLLRYRQTRRNPKGNCDSSDQVVPERAA